MPARFPVFRPTRLEDCENVGLYRPGGLHPLMPEQVIGSGRYKILNKLGAGGGATVWLARVLEIGSLVCVKVLRADHALVHGEEATEVAVYQALCAAGADLRARLLVVHRTFVEVGPNGAHTCVVMDVAGPNLAALAAENGRLRAGHARVLARQVAGFMLDMHAAGYVHGDLRSGNVLLRLDASVSTWSDKKVLEVFDEPSTDELVRYDRQPRDAPSDGAPAELVEALPAFVYVDAGIVRMDAVVIDFGQSFPVAAKPQDYAPATAHHYRAPETRFDDAVTTATDVWALGCLLYELRAGRMLFENFANSEAEITPQWVTMLGKFPDPWWAAWDDRHKHFHEDGQPLEGQWARLGIRAELREIGAQDQPWRKTKGELYEVSGARLDEEEVELLGDLLERMLRYRPEERITMDQVLAHPWFAHQ